MKKPELAPDPEGLVFAGVGGTLRVFEGAALLEFVSFRLKHIRYF